MKIHIIRRSDGTGGIDSSKTLNDLTQANSLYDAADFTFVKCGNINYIDNDTYNTKIQKCTSSTCDEQKMVNDNKVHNALNVFYLDHFLVSRLRKASRNRIPMGKEIPATSI